MSEQRLIPGPIRDTLIQTGLIENDWTYEDLKKKMTILIFRTSLENLRKSLPKTNDHNLAV